MRDATLIDDDNAALGVGVVLIVKLLRGAPRSTVATGALERGGALG